MFCIRKAVPFLLLITSIVAFSQMHIEDEPDCGESGAIKVEIAKADATILGLTIGRASLQDVQAKLGRAKVTRVSKDEESDISICYVSPKDGTVIAFYSGVMGGDADVTWFALWSRKAEFAHSSQCTPSGAVSRDLSTDSGLRLGLTEKELKGIEGIPTKHDSMSIKYDYLCRRKMTEDEINRFKTENNWDVQSKHYFDRMSWINVRYTNSTVSRIEIGQIDSY